MSTPGEIVPPDEVFQRLLPHTSKLTHYYGAIVILSDDGHIASKGSMALVSAPTGHFIFTARHVADEIRAKAGHVFIRPEISEEKSLFGIFTGFVQFPLNATDIAWSSDQMDIAAFRAPSAMLDLAHLRWFDAKLSAIAATAVRKKRNPEVPFPTIIMGCPNFGHFRDGDLETLSFLVMQGYITALDREPWDGFSRIPQVHVEIEDGSRREQPQQDGFRQRIWEELQEQTVAKAVPFGGYSGAPFIVIGSDGEFLIGIITEGDYVFGNARATAVAWDDIMTAFEQALSG